MKKYVLLTLIGLLAFVAIGDVFGQTNAPTTGNEMLAKVLSETNTIPLEIYPPTFFDWLEAMGDNPLPSAPHASARPVRPQAIGPLIAENGSIGRFGMMMARPSPDDPAPEYDYAVIDLGTFGGSQSAATGINNYSQITGWADPSNGYRRAFIFDISMHDISPTNSDYSEAYGINGNAQITGYGTFAGSGNTHAFRYTYLGNSMEVFGTLGGSHSYGLAINDGGWVVGSSWTTNNYDVEAFRYLNTSLEDIGTLGGDYSQAYGINASGQIVGESHTNNGTIIHAFLDTDNVMTDIGTFGGNDSSARGINAYGEVVGWASTSGGAHHAFFYDYQNSTMEDLGTLSGAASSEAYGMNVNAHVVGSSGGHAFLVSNGSMKDLNDVVINAGSGWTLQYAYGINDNEQIVGVGTNSSGQSHAFLLNPLPLGWQANITADTSRYTLGNIGTAASGKDSLILITHGAIPSSDDPIVSTGWVDSMSNSIVSYLTAHSITNWQVRGYKWIDGAHIPNYRGGPQTALQNAKQQGVGVGFQILAQGYTHVHLISHSAGAGLIQSATDVIKTNSSSVVVHETFLDPFIGFKFSGTSTYGANANWAENYSTKDRETGNEIMPFTYNILEHAYNVDVTQLDINDRKQLAYWVSGTRVPCYTTESVHGWPIDFYSNTITGTVTSDYEGFGFPLSEVGSNWSYALSNYTPGNGSPGHVLGTPDPTGCRFEFPAPSYPSFITDFINSPAVQSVTGTIEKYPNGSVKHKSGSPAWLATFITVSNVANIVSFDAEFQSTNAAQGLLSVYWDGNTIGSIDERVVQDGFQHYTFKFPNASGNSVHMLGFRLDPFTNMQSIVVVTNVATSFSGVSQPFSLAIVGSTNGLLTYQLNGQSGFEYHIQASTNLFDWTSIAVLANTNGTVQFFDQDSTNHTQRFYRAVAPY